MGFLAGLGVFLCCRFFNDWVATLEATQRWHLRWSLIGLDTEWPLKLSALQVTCLCIAAVALPIMYCETRVLRVHRRASTGLDFDRWTPDKRRVGIKYLGLLLTLAPIILAYLVFPEYGDGKYQALWRAAAWGLPLAMLIAPWYMHLVDARQRDPEDGYWQVGNAALALFTTTRRSRIDRARLAQHARAWLVKAFFLPLMFGFLYHDVRFFLDYVWQLPEDSLHLAHLTLTRHFQAVYEGAYEFIFAIDVLFATVGYLCTFRLVDSHTRSTEPSLFGWVVALLCYPPFWAVFGASYLAYGNGYTWGTWLYHTPWAYCLWGSAILLLIMIYTWATITFGIRFSNLTHRGVLTNGPYRFTKHPAYLAKNLSWWLINIPFIPFTAKAEMQDPLLTLKLCLLCALMNLIYFLRAWTEERHLSQDPDYVRYALSMDQRPWLRFCGRWLPWLSYGWRYRRWRATGWAASLPDQMSTDDNSAVV